MRAGFPTFPFRKMEMFECAYLILIHVKDAHALYTTHKRGMTPMLSSPPRDVKEMEAFAIRKQTKL